VLADISGYTTFVTQTEIDHSWEILHELLEVMVRSAEGKLDVTQVEGDAILFISGLDEEEVMKAIEATFIGFHRRRRDMVAVTTCPCNACQRIDILKLKFIVHRGRFSRQRLGGVEQLHGTDVIVPHRLAKNKVPLKEYLLATESVLERLSEARRSRFTPYEDTFDLGVVKAGYEPLDYLWEQAQAAEPTRVSEEMAILAGEVVAEAPVEKVGEKVLLPGVIKRYAGSQAVDAFAGARGAEVGSEFHCQHGYGTNYWRVIAFDKERELTLVSTTPLGIVVYITMAWERESADRTRVRLLWWWQQPPEPEEAARVMGAASHEHALWLTGLPMAFS